MKEKAAQLAAELAELLDWPRQTDDRTTRCYGKDKFAEASCKRRSCDLFLRVEEKIREAMRGTGRPRRRQLPNGPMADLERNRGCLTPRPSVFTDTESRIMLQHLDARTSLQA